MPAAGNATFQPVGNVIFDTDEWMFWQCHEDHRGSELHVINPFSPSTRILYQRWMDSRKAWIVDSKTRQMYILSHKRDERDASFTCSLSSIPLDVSPPPTPLWTEDVQKDSSIPDDFFDPRYTMRLLWLHQSRQILLLYNEALNIFLTMDLTTTSRKRKRTSNASSAEWTYALNLAKSSTVVDGSFEIASAPSGCSCICQVPNGTVFFELVNSSIRQIDWDSKRVSTISAMGVVLDEIVDIQSDSFGNLLMVERSDGEWWESSSRAKRLKRLDHTTGEIQTLEVQFPPGVNHTLPQLILDSVSQQRLWMAFQADQGQTHVWTVAEVLPPTKTGADNDDMRLQFVSSAHDRRQWAHEHLLSFFNHAMGVAALIADFLFI